jgi:hypothetical protein
MPTVYVYESDGDLRVFPPVVVLKPNDSSLEIVNMSDEDVSWTVPKSVFPNKHQQDVSQGQHHQHPNQPPRGAQGVTRHWVTGKDSGRRAKGNSDPIIIIDM